MRSFLLSWMLFLCAFILASGTTGRPPGCPFSCPAQRICQEPNCKPNQILKPDRCGCCPICYTPLHKGNRCWPNDPNSGCVDGLVCLHGRCQFVEITLLDD